MSCREKLSELTACRQSHISGDEISDPQLFLDRLFQVFSQAGLKEDGATLGIRVTWNTEVGGTAPFTDLVGKLDVPGNYPDAKKLLTKDCPRSARD